MAFKMYTYRILSSEGDETFEYITSENILLADKAFELKTGMNPAKPPKGYYIGVSIK